MTLGNTLSSQCKALNRALINLRHSLRPSHHPLLKSFCKFARFARFNAKKICLYILKTLEFWANNFSTTEFTELQKSLVVQKLEDEPKYRKWRISLRRPEMASEMIH